MRIKQIKTAASEDYAAAPPAQVDVAQSHCEGAGRLGGKPGVVLSQRQQRLPATRVVSKD